MASSLDALLSFTPRPLYSAIIVGTAFYFLLRPLLKLLIHFVPNASTQNRKLHPFSKAGLFPLLPLPFQYVILRGIATTIPSLQTQTAEPATKTEKHCETLPLVPSVPEPKPVSSAQKPASPWQPTRGPKSKGADKKNAKDKVVFQRAVQASGNGEGSAGNLASTRFDLPWWLLPSERFRNVNIGAVWVFFVSYLLLWGARIWSSGGSPFEVVSATLNFTHAIILVLSVRVLSFDEPPRAPFANTIKLKKTAASSEEEDDADAIPKLSNSASHLVRLLHRGIVIHTILLYPQLASDLMPKSFPTSVAAFLGTGAIYCIVGVQVYAYGCYRELWKIEQISEEVEEVVGKKKW
ncbi:hypothetical protein BC829DRAFT_412479 [Chytridium lagenaria]|nr:hypothetical protein BC829DRAFT_412479 [Chytridium lagenaria]